MGKKILLINNYTNRIKDIKKLFDSTQLECIELEKFSIKEHYDKYDAFVLSGGSKYSLLENETVYSELISLIEQSTKPILGISLGFEIIGYTFDETLEKAVGFGSGIRQIKVKEKEDPIFEGVNSDFVAAEAHKWFFSGLKNLKILATSQRGVEIARHPEKNIYGIQFHPEIDIGDINSKKLIKNFLKLI